MPDAWRIVKKEHAATAFSGEGAAKSAGRLNSKGVRVVYSSGTRALAALENLVHLNPPVRFKYVIFRIEFDVSLVQRLQPKALPRNWRAEPPPPSTQRLGDAWVGQARSAVLAVPSVIIAGETNYLLNPAHRDFKKITIGRPQSFAFDSRLLS